MLKRLLLVFVCFLSLGLVGCVKHLTVDSEVFEVTIGELDVDITHLMASRDGVLINNEIERVEILDASNLEAILIHIIISSTLPGMDEDYMLLITPEWIYSTKNMTKADNGIDATDPQGFRTLIYRYTNLIDIDLLNSDALQELAESLGTPELSRVRENYTFLGHRPLTEPLPNDMVEIAKYLFANNRLEELHLNREYDFESTYQRSNYVSGTHYYFSNALPIDFPPLSGFTLID